MLLALVLLGAGAAVMAVSAEWAVRGASRLAVATGISGFALGALLFGIDLEGAGTAFVAAGRGQTSIAAGEAYGTVVFLFSAAFGAALLIARRPVDAPSPIMVIAPSVPILASAFSLFDRVVTRVDAVFLLAVYAGYVAAVLSEGRAVQTRGDELRAEVATVKGGGGRAALLTAAGLAGLVVGAWLLVTGGLRVLERTPLTAGFVGAAIIATLASLDEVFLEVMPVRRGRPELATGNLFGTVAAFTTFVPGVAALIRPLVVDGTAAVTFLAAAGLYTIVAVTFLLRDRAWRVLGVVVLAAYVGWLWYGAQVR